MNRENSFGFRKSAVAIVALCAALASAPAPVLARTATSKIVVVKPLTFVKIDDLNFGQMLASNQAGTVILSPSGSRTATNGIVLIGNKHRPASFAGFGSYLQNVSISVGANQIWITGPGTRMRVRNFTVGSTPSVVLTTAKQSFYIGSGSGIFAFPVGAELAVGANQAPGVYTGTWTINLNYQ
jgi:Domain of unknown function (DUF4402)